LRKLTIILITLLLLTSCGTTNTTTDNSACESWTYTIHDYEHHQEWGDKYNRDIHSGTTETVYNVSKEEFWRITPSEGYIKREGCNLHLHGNRRENNTLCGEWAYVLYTHEWIEGKNRLKLKDIHMREVSGDKFWETWDGVYFKREGCTISGIVELEDLSQ
jgi:hypothetical protein